MTTEEQQLAIQKVMGWKPRNASSMRPDSYYHLEKPVNQNPPSYDSDWDALHEAVSSLSVHQGLKWVMQLEQIVIRGWTEAHPEQRLDILDVKFLIAQSSLPQRLEALCRTLWPERFNQPTKGEGE